MTMIVRNGQFGAVEHPERWWHGGDPVATAFYTTISLAFPPGERFFVETLIEAADRLPPALRRDVRDFARQEANHARQHIAFNRTMAAIGHRTAELEERIARQLNDARSHPLLIRVAFTTALEHLTTLLARAILRHPRMLSGAPEDTRRFWRWHAVEEIEHKAVAFDVYLHLAADMTPLGRWLLRARAMRAATRVILSYAAMSEALLRDDGRAAAKVRPRLLWFLMVRPGLLRLCLPGWLGFFLPGFHPDRRSDAGLLATAPV